MIAIFQMISGNPYLLLAICYLLSYTFYVKLAFTCKNVFPFAPVVRLVIFSKIIPPYWRPALLLMKLPFKVLSLAT